MGLGLGGLGLGLELDEKNQTVVETSPKHETEPCMLHVVIAGLLNKIRISPSH